MTPHERCAICDCDREGNVWPESADKLCPAHDRLAVLWAAVRSGDCSEWRANSGGKVSHVEMQTRRANRGATGHWTREVADVLAVYGCWLDGWDEEAAA